MILAWRPGIADLLGLESFGEGKGREGGTRWALAPVGLLFAARGIVSARDVAEGCSQKKKDPLDGSRAVF